MPLGTIDKPAAGFYSLSAVCDASFATLPAMQRQDIAPTNRVIGNLVGEGITMRERAGLTCRSGVLAVSVTLVAASASFSQNTISFGEVPASAQCGGLQVLCTSSNGVTGYSGNTPFDLSKIDQWFQVDGKTPLPGQPKAQISANGFFLVTNDTGAVVTSFTLTITDNFSAGVGCSGLKDPLKCQSFVIDNGILHSGNYFGTVTLAGPDWVRCSVGATTVVKTCSDQSAAAQSSTTGAVFSPGTMTYTWSAGSDAGVPAKATFLIGFAGWLHEGDPDPVPEPAPALLLGIGLISVIGFAVVKPPTN